MRRLQLAFLLISIVLVAGCSTLTRNPQFYLSYYDLKSPEINDFETCSSAGCRQLSRLFYTESEWQSIRAIFQPAQQNAAEERERLLVAVAAIETLIGEKKRHLDRLCQEPTKRESRPAARLHRRSCQHHCRSVAATTRRADTLSPSRTPSTSRFRPTTVPS